MKLSLFILLLLATFIPSAIFNCHLKGLDLDPEKYHVNDIISHQILQNSVLLISEITFFTLKKHKRPGADDDTLMVYGQLNLRNIVGVDDSKMMISLEISLR